MQEELKKTGTNGCYGELEDNRKSCLGEIEQLEVSESTVQEKRRNCSGQGQKEPDLEAKLALQSACWKKINCSMNRAGNEKKQLRCWKN